MKQLKILVIGDEEHTRLGYSEVLKISGYDVDMAENGSEGLFKADNKAYDVIITDLKTPKSDEIEFIDKLKEKQINSEIIVITALDSSELTDEHNSCAYLSRPVTAACLEAAIRQFAILRI